MKPRISYLANAVLICLSFHLALGIVFSNRRSYSQFLAIQPLLTYSVEPFAWTLSFARTWAACCFLCSFLSFSLRGL